MVTKRHRGHNFKLVRRIMKEPLQGKRTETDTEREDSKQDMEFWNF